MQSQRAIPIPTTDTTLPSCKWVWEHLVLMLIQYFQNTMFVFKTFLSETSSVRDSTTTWFCLGLKRPLFWVRVQYCKITLFIMITSRYQTPNHEVTFPISYLKLCDVLSYCLGLLMLLQQVFLDLSEKNSNGPPKLPWGLPDTLASHWTSGCWPSHHPRLQVIPPFQAFPVRPWSPPSFLPLPGLCD